MLSFNPMSLLVLSLSLGLTLMTGMHGVPEGRCERGHALRNTMAALFRYDIAMHAGFNGGFRDTLFN